MSELRRQLIVVLGRQKRISPARTALADAALAVFVDWLRSDEADAAARRGRPGGTGVSLTLLADSLVSPP